MKFPIIACTALCLSLLLLSGGCTMPAAPADRAPVTPAPVTLQDSSALRDLALKPADLPDCYRFSGERVKTAADVGTLAKDLGWQAGYAISYHCNGDAGPVDITHSLAVYPERNLPGIVSMVDTQDRAAGFSCMNISPAGTDGTMQGFTCTRGEPEENETSPGSFVTGGNGGEGPTPAGGRNFTEIILHNRTVFEVLRMTGPGADATLLGDLAVTSRARLGS